VRLEECRVPAQIQRQMQYVDLFPDIDAGTKQLAQLIRKEARRRNQL
jgi:hypothetical protein